MSNIFNQPTINGDIQIIINAKRERSQSPELSDSSISSAEVKRSKKINYFLGGGKKEWTPKEEVFVENINITEVLKRFRKQSIAEVEKNKDINCLRILGTKPKIIRAPAKAVVYCKNKADEGDDDEDNDNDDSEEEGEGQDGIMSMVKDLVRYEKQYRACISNSSEATFTEKYLASAIRRVLLKDAGEDLLYAMIDKPEKNGKKPDYMFGTKIKRREVYFFFVEVKRPEMKSKYQPEDDFTKLMKQMKGSVDDQLCLGSKNPTSLGLLVEGFKCTLFQMKLLADGIYMPMAFERFSLVEEIHQLVHLPAIVEALFFVKSELAKFIDETLLSIDLTTSTALLVVSFAVVSFSAGLEIK
ncbi:hypothetical protein G6F19_011030 [Rhizopus arrhizus]|nr:hypothetical protein G6F19_011030 [Rhizopus arrhizus]KAG1179135.1 hypothetical protein G6F36_010592 [Rhizopus arrhizus]